MRTARKSEMSLYFHFDLRNCFNQFELSNRGQCSRAGFVAHGEEEACDDNGCQEVLQENQLRRAGLEGTIAIPELSN